MLLGCEEQLLPSWRALQSPDPEQLAEERRLFYVACTRAKDQLISPTPPTRGVRPDRRPVRFLARSRTDPPIPGARRLNNQPASKEPTSCPTPTPTPTTARHDAPARRAHARRGGELFRRPFAPGAIGFRAMTKVR